VIICYFFLWITSGHFVLISNLTHFLMCLFHFSTCFEQPSAHHQENQLYQHIIWYISLCVGGRLVCRSERSDIYQMYWYNWFSWWWTLSCSKHVERWNEHFKKCLKLIINTNCTEMHGQQNITHQGMSLWWLLCPILLTKRIESELPQKVNPSGRAF
jgi:hypothetical protein